MPTIQKGKLIAWKDDKGFGFIKPDGRNDGTMDIFLHITALKNGSPRPKIGDTIYYELRVGNHGKNRAVNAFIEGTFLPSASKSLTPSRQPTRREKKRGYTLGDVILTPSKAVVVIFLGAVVAWGLLKIDSRGGNHGWEPSKMNDTQGSSRTSCTKTPLRPGCNIKGNISQHYDDERMHIYHMPGGKYYEGTVICPAEGERWFCSEEEAITAGWRKSMDK